VPASAGGRFGRCPVSFRSITKYFWISVLAFQQY